MCELTPQMLLLCNCSLSLNVCNIGLQCNLRIFLSTIVLQGSIATRVNYGRIFNDYFIANLLLSVMVKNFEDRLAFGKVMAKNKVAPFFQTRCSYILLHPEMVTNRSTKWAQHIIKHSLLTNSHCCSFSSISITHHFSFILFFSLFSMLLL